jgi:hypothetical protein
MVLRTITAAALVGAALAPSQTLAAPAAPATPSGICPSLAREYDGIEKSLASTYAEGIGDDSAPRETNRQVENSNDLMRASMVLTLMQAHHCSLPDHSPSAIRYLSPALSCATDRLKGVSQPPSCDQSTWQPISADKSAPSPE